MNDIRHIQRRIRKRRGSGREERKEQPLFLFRFLYRMVMAAMCIAVVFMLLLVNDKAKLIKLPAFIEKLQPDNIAQWIPFENWFSLKEEAVASIPSYSLLKDNRYSNGSNTAYNAYHGVVLHVQQMKDGKSSVSLKQDNGVVATYGNLDEVHVKQDERILKGKLLGTYTSYITIDFLKDQQKISYEKALSEDKG